MFEQCFGTCVTNFPRDCASLLTHLGCCTHWYFVGKGTAINPRGAGNRIADPGRHWEHREEPGDV